MCCPVHGAETCQFLAGVALGLCRFVQYGFNHVGWLALDMGIQVSWQAGIEVICTSLLVLSGVARANHSYKSGVHEWRWPTQAQLTRREFVETSMSWAGSETGHLVPLSRRGR